LPVQRMIRMTLSEIEARARQFAKAVQSSLSSGDAQLDIIDGTSLLGGGSTPAQSIPTKLIRVSSSRYSAAGLEQRLRAAEDGIPVIARIEEDLVLIDLRTVFPEQESALATSLLAALR
jgi:L-seryl-tRNA(Ser) seleniumtransferase